MSFNVRMTCIQAALGLAQLKHVDNAVWKRRYIGAYYTKWFRSTEVEDIFILPSTFDPNGNPNMFWVYWLRLRNPWSWEVTVGNIIQKLSEKKLGSRPHFWPLHKQPVFITWSSRYFQSHFWDQCLLHAEYFWNNSFYIPSGIGMSDLELRAVADRVCAICRDLSKGKDK